MENEQPNLSTLHCRIIKHVIEKGYAPELSDLTEIFRCSQQEVIQALQNLQNEHGVVLHPNSAKIWVIHPFSLAPTNFLVRDGKKEWWCNCAWCALGAAALLDRDVVITTCIGANGKQLDVHITKGRLVETNLYVHFPIPMRQAWDNVIYTCSTMLLFENEDQIDAWCEMHRIAKGDVQPIAKIWEFAKAWYGNHLSADWRKWTAEEAKAIFERFGLTSEIWQIPASASRF